MVLSFIIIGLSISMQIIAAWLAIPLISKYKKYMVGTLLLIMIFMQAFRRIISFYRAISSGYIKTDIYAEIAALIVSIILVFGVIYTLKLIKELTEALNSIKILKGFLPICASCKKIRDDKGSWVQMEKYITQHSEAIFSHGVCDECAKKLYPAYFIGDK
jgi:hypothetical protein